MKRYRTYTAFASALIGGLLLWRGMHDAWRIDGTRADWHGQAFPQGWKEPLLWVNLGMQLGIGAGLWAGIVWRPIRPLAFEGAASLLAAYTVYAELALLERLPRKPCACIGWWEGSTWAWLVAANATLLIGVIIAFMLERSGQGRRSAMA